MHRITLPAILLLALCGCDTAADGGNALAPATAQAGNGATAPTKPQAGHIVGRVLDTRGQPLAGADILVENALLYARYLRGTSGADGRFRVPVATGAWRVQASIVREYHGRSYTLELEPSSTDTFGGEGGVVDFTWKLQGRSPGSGGYGYHGGFVQLSTALDYHGDLSDVELVFTPSGPLIDGSSGETLRLRMHDHYWVQTFQIEDIPIGRYIVTATRKDADGEHPMRIADWYRQRAGNADFQTEYQLDFLPNPPNGGRNSASIVIGP
ncbi:hypothetical protein MASR1M8_01240 [Thermomonas brevis]